MLSDLIIALCSTMIGTILGWGLSVLSSNSGEIQIYVLKSLSGFQYDYVYGKKKKKGKWEPISFSVVLELLVVNNKISTSGINGCRIFIGLENSKKYYMDSYLPIQEDDNLNHLLNIPAKTSKKARYAKQIDMFSLDEKVVEEMEKKGYDICLEYRVNGKKRLKEFVLISNHH